MKREDLMYWVATGLFCAAFSMGGTSHLLRLPNVAESMSALGYPAYMMTILGVAKLLGVAALLIPQQPFLKEWAYAGFAFDLLGAIASHLFAGDPIVTVIPPMVVMGLGAASYALRPASRRLAPAFSTQGSV